MMDGNLVVCEFGVSVSVSVGVWSLLRYGGGGCFV